MSRSLQYLVDSDVGNAGVPTATAHYAFCEFAHDLILRVRY